MAPTQHKTEASKSQSDKKKQADVKDQVASKYPGQSIQKSTFKSMANKEQVPQRPITNQTAPPVYTTIDSRIPAQQTKRVRFEDENINRSGPSRKETKPQPAVMLKSAMKQTTVAHSKSKIELTSAGKSSTSNSLVPYSSSGQDTRSTSQSHGQTIKSEAHKHPGVIKTALAQASAPAPSVRAPSNPTPSARVPSNPAPSTQAASAKAPSIPAQSNPAPSMRGSVFKAPQDLVMASRQTRINTLSSAERTKQEDWAQSHIASLGLCAGKKKWDRIPGGYICKAGYCFMTDELISRGQGELYSLRIRGDPSPSSRVGPRTPAHIEAMNRRWEEHEQEREPQQTRPTVTDTVVVRPIVIQRPIIVEPLPLLWGPRYFGHRYFDYPFL